MSGFDDLVYGGQGKESRERPVQGVRTIFLEWMGEMKCQLG